MSKSSYPAPISRASLPSSGSLYWAVTYEKNGCISLRPCGEIKESALEFLEDFLSSDPRLLEACEATTVIKRDMSQVTDKWLFGRCKANDVVVKLKGPEKTESKKKGAERAGNKKK